jgi:hypothetical protein
MFGFLEQNSGSLLQSSVTLDTMNKFKQMNVDYFFGIVSEMNIDNSEIQVKYSKNEFHVIETIVTFIINPSLASCCITWKNPFFVN